MGTIDMRTTALIKERERLLQRIRECEYKIARVREQQNYAVFTSSSSSEEEEPLAESQALSQVPSLAHSKQQEELEGLQTSLQATEELGSVTVLESKVKKLPSPPEDLNLEEDELPHGDWTRYEARCNMMDTVPFSISFLLHAPLNLTPCYHDTKLTILKPSLEAEYRPLAEPLSSPLAELVRLRAFSKMIMIRRHTLRLIVERMGGELLVEEAEGGGVKLTEQRQKLVVLWTFQLESPYSHIFINKMEVTCTAAFGEGKRKEIQELVDSLAEPQLSSSVQTDLIQRLVTVMWSSESVEPHDGTPAPREREVIQSQEAEQGSETEALEEHEEDEDAESLLQKRAATRGKNPKASSSGVVPESRIPVKKKR